jgi:hypothetical protein
MTGCSFQHSAIVSPSAIPSVTFSGSVYGAQAPIGSASIQLYEVGTGGDGSAPTALLSVPAVTDPLTGTFTISTPYTCPTPATLVYIVSTGGNPGLTPVVNNSAIMLMAALGQCGSLSSSTKIHMNEATTVAAAAALAPFMTAPYSVGSSTSDAAALATAFTNAIDYADTVSGNVPGVGEADSSTTGGTVPVAEINTLADILESCVNSTGPTSSTCAALFKATGGPTDVLSAIVNVEKNPSSYSASTLFGLAPSGGPFQPQLTAPPSTFAVTMSSPGGTSGTLSTADIVTNPGTAAVGQSIQLTSQIGAIFTSPLSINFGGVAGAGSFTSTVINALVPSGSPYGLITGNVHTQNGTYPFQVYVTSGAAAVPSLSPGTLGFANQALLTQSAAKAVTLTNNTSNAVRVNSGTISGTNASSFSVTSNTCTSGTIAVNATCVFNVVFTPQATGGSTAALTVYVNGTALPTAVGLQGTGQ